MNAVSLEQVLVLPASREALIGREQVRALIEARVASDEVGYWTSVRDLVEQLVDGDRATLPHRLAVVLDAAALVLSGAVQAVALGLETDAETAAGYVFTSAETVIQEVAAETRGAAPWA